MAKLPASEWARIINSGEYSERTRNDAANRLLNLDHPGLSAQLLRMLRDPNESLLWRNYCVQFLKACYEKVPDPNVLNALEASLAAPEPGIASCALWSLAQLAAPEIGVSSLPGQSREWLHRMALDTLAKEDLPLLVRTGAVQSCARLGLAEGLPAIRRLAFDEKAYLFLRTVALASLGNLKDLASREDLTHLAQTAASLRLRRAAEAALKQIPAP